MAKKKRKLRRAALLGGGVVATGLTVLGVRKIIGLKAEKRRQDKIWVAGVPVGKMFGALSDLSPANVARVIRQKVVGF